MVGNHPYVLQGDAKELERFAGGQATVSGMISGDRIQVGLVTRPGEMPQTLSAQEQPATNAGR
jgi:hypothetical protein